MFNKRQIILTAAVFTTALLFYSTVFAGTIQLPKTGQTTSYRTGDDGDLEMGVAWHNPRFTINGDCVTDNLTGLMWPKNGNLAGYMSWYSAIDYANNLTLCGYSDWRLPNVNELESLVNAGEPDTAAWLNTQGFINVQSGGYWSSTTLAGSEYDAYYVNMWAVYILDSYVNIYTKGISYYVWPVRSEQVGGSFDYYCDDDGDGYIDSSIDGNCSGNGCVPSGCQTTQGDDCNDNNASIHPGATEILRNGIDDDCNPATPDSADLYISGMSAPSSANSGDTISVSDTTNKSGVSLVGSTTTKIYLSTDNKWWTNDTYLGSRAVPAFGAGAQSSSGSTNVTIPANTCTKTYYLIAKADADTFISEWNEGNNNKAISIAITRPDPSSDLYVSSVSAPVLANAGDAITVTDTTNKSGCATGASTTRVYLSKYSSGYGGIEIGSGRTVPAFTSNPGAQTNSGSTIGTIPSGGCTGSCYIVVKADADGAIAEWNEGNNKRATAITINP